MSIFSCLLYLLFPIPPIFPNKDPEGEADAVDEEIVELEVVACQ